MNQQPSPCEPCALRDASDTTQAGSTEAIRAYRLVLAMLNGAADATAEITAELGACHDCTARLAALALAMYAASLTHMAGGEAKAAEWVERSLMDAIDAQDSHA